MRRPLLLIAVLVVLAANGWAVFQAWRNRAEPRGGRVELTERELRLEPVSLESTAMFLDLRWSILPGAADDANAPTWLNATKLAELGFDCRLAVDAPTARRHYNSVPPRPVYLVIEYQETEPPIAPADRENKSRLFVIDAGRQPATLRSRYADPGRYILAQGLVGLVYRDRNRDGTRLPMPRLEGRVLGLSPNQIFVPRPYNRLLRQFQSTDSGPRSSDSAEPRYAATVSWGSNYEPWITNVRLLKTQLPDSKPR